MNFPVIPQNLSISAMRSSGYRDTAHAIAELVDNAIQSGLESKRQVGVEVICIEEAADPASRPQITKIAVLDNAGGMSPETLRVALQFGNGTRLDPSAHVGIGKFGMGLPNSSISQGKRVEVWSWQNGRIWYSYLDVKEIEDGMLDEVPPPRPATLPSEWLSVFMNEPGESGTLVVWSKLDRVTWKQSSTLLRHVEFIAGRVYRRFITNQEVRIRLASYRQDGAALHPGWESFIRPNDPLYLSTGTNAPPPYDQRPAFELFREHKFSVWVDGEPHTIQLRASVAKAEVRVGEGGNKPIGKHAKRNQGVSVLRAGRELEMNSTFERVDPRERWWGIEVEFSPALDDLFGVTNNKQSATNFYRMRWDEDAEAEDMPVAKYKEMLEKEGDPRLPMYAISGEIDELLDDLRMKINAMRHVHITSQRLDTLSNKVERSASESVAKRRKYVGDIGLSDKQESAPAADRTRTLTASIEDEGVESTKARQIAVDYVEKHVKFRVKHAGLPTNAMFAVSAESGIIVLTFNERHPVHSKLFEAFKTTSEPNPISKEVLSLFIAWARMEDEANSGQLRNMYQDVRESWGRLAKDFFEPEDG